MDHSVWNIDKWLPCFASLGYEGKLGLSFWGTFLKIFLGDLCGTKCSQRQINISKLSILISSYWSRKVFPLHRSVIFSFLFVKRPKELLSLNHSSERPSCMLWENNRFHRTDHYSGHQNSLRKTIPIWWRKERTRLVNRPVSGITL